jgi:hypothetical protein
MRTKIVAWISKLRSAAGDNAPTEARKPWLTQLRDAAETMAKQSGDPWAPILANLKGHVVGGIERIATFRVFELLGIPPRAQSSDIRRRLARRMVEHGWQPIRAHGLNERSFLTRVRGFARPADHEGTPRQPVTRRGSQPGSRVQPLM